MPNFQIALSGVTPGTYGGEGKIPCIKIDKTGRVTFADEVDINPTLNIEAGFNRKPIGLKTEILKFSDSDSIKFTTTEDGVIANVNPEGFGAVVKNTFGVVSEDLKIQSLNAYGKVSAGTVDATALSVSEIKSSNDGLIEGKFQQLSLYGFQATEQGPYGNSFTGLSLKRSRGDEIDPKDVQDKDNLHTVDFRGLKGDRYMSFGGISCKVSQYNDRLKGMTYLYSLDEQFELTTAALLGNVFVAPTLSSSGLTEEEKSNPMIPPGTIIYNKTLDKFQGYTKNSGWVDLH